MGLLWARSDTRGRAITSGILHASRIGASSRHSLPVMTFVLLVLRPSRKVTLGVFAKTALPYDHSARDCVRALGFRLRRLVTVQRFGDPWEKC